MQLIALGKINLAVFVPSVILALCVLEMSFGNLVQFRVVHLFYLYSAYFIFFRFRKATFHFKWLSLVLYLALVLTYCIAVVLSNDIYITNQSELFNILWWSIFGFFTCAELKSVSSQLSFLKIFCVLVFWGTVVSAAAGIYKLVLIEQFGIIPELAVYDGNLIFGSALHPDYNIYALGIFFGVLCGKYLMEIYSSSRIFRVCSYLSFPLMFTTMVLSGSRRAIILCLFLLVIYFVFNFRKDVTVKSFMIKKGNRAILLIGAISGFLAVMYTALEDAIMNAGFVSGLSRLLSIKEDFGGKNDRTERWEFANRYWEDISISDFLFGRGFDYLNDYGRFFNFGQDDHPHNFLIATFIYGGAVSLFLLCIALFKIVRYYYNGSSFKIFFFFIFFLIFFSLTSTNTLFSFRIIPFLLVLPIFMVGEKSKAKLECSVQ